MTDQRRQIPSVDALLAASGALIAQHGRAAVVEALRDAQTTARIQARAGGPVPDAAALIAQAQAALDDSARPTLYGLINATGIILHTNLGRAPLSATARQALLDVSAGYSTLELDMQTGARGSRYVHAARLLAAVTGAESGLVVNNAASALVLTLAAVAQGREVVISRGQLVEIGGGFRIPEIMTQSGALLVEVGTTNRTRTADYAAALTDRTALLLHVHASNFKQIGFVESAPLDELAALAHKRSLLLVNDLGSGALLDTAAYGLEHEPTAQESVAAGADLTIFSGDKLLGGPQAGIIVGAQALIDRLKAHPLARALRADKLCYAALNATLEHYRRGEAVDHVPVWRMIARPLEALHSTAERWRDTLIASAASASADQRLPVTALTVITGESAVGGGSLPGATLPTALLALTCAAPQALQAALRRSGLITRIERDQLLLDPRTVQPNQEAALLEAVRTNIILSGSDEQQ